MIRISLQYIMGSIIIMMLPFQDYVSSKEGFNLQAKCFAVSVCPFLDASLTAQVLLVDGSTLLSASKGFAVSVCPFFDANRVAKLLSADGSTLSSASKSFVVSVCPHRDADLIA